MRTAVAVGSCCAALALAPAPPASADIVIGEGIRGVELGMSKGQVLAQVGPPRKKRKGRSEFGRFVVLKYGRKLTVTLTRASVTLVSTRHGRQVTDAGIGVGSSKRQVKRRVPGVVCDRVAGPRTCRVGDFLPGASVTVFRLKRKVVATVQIGLVLD